MDVAYLDFSKAFDTVPHNRLLQKLDKLGVHGHLLDWFSDYMPVFIFMIVTWLSLSITSVQYLGVSPLVLYKGMF